MKIKFPQEQHNIVIDNSFSNLSHIKLTKVQSSSLSSSTVGEEDCGRKRCSYRIVHANSFSKSTITYEFNSSSESSFQQRTLQLSKTCSYKRISASVKYSNKCELQEKQFVDYREYLKLLNDCHDLDSNSLKITDGSSSLKYHSNQSQEQLLVQQDSDCDESDQQGANNQTPMGKKKKISKTKEKRNTMMNDTRVQELNEEYKKIKDQNSLKNIKEAFMRHVNSELSEDLKNIYIQRMGGKLQFGQIKKKINFSLKENSTNNKCIKFMCKSNQVSPVFLYFLEHIDEFWLNDSKVQSKDACKAIVSFLIKIIQNVQFIDLIEHYHTKI